MPKTLTMIDPRPNGSGGQYERGQTYTLADDLADYFLSIGVARYPTLQQTQVLADRDPATGEVSTIGTGRDPLGAPVVAVTSPGGGNRLLAGNLPADMAQLSNVVVSDGALQSWTANGIDYVATYADGKVATVTASDGWVQTYAWAGDVPTITVAEV